MSFWEEMEARVLPMCDVALRHAITGPGMAHEALDVLHQVLGQIVHGRLRHIEVTPDMQHAVALIIDNMQRVFAQIDMTSTAIHLTHTSGPRGVA